MYSNYGTEETTQQLKTCTAFAEDLSSTPRTNNEQAYKCLEPQLQRDEMPLANTGIRTNVHILMHAHKKK